MVLIVLRPKFQLRLLDMIYSDPHPVSRDFASFPKSSFAHCYIHIYIDIVRFHVSNFYNSDTIWSSVRSLLYLSVTSIARIALIARRNIFINLLVRVDCHFVDSSLRSFEDNLGELFACRKYTEDSDVLSHRVRNGKFCIRGFDLYGRYLFLCLRIAFSIILNISDSMESFQVFIFI